jgi:hypothetical protein
LAKTFSALDELVRSSGSCIINRLSDSYSRRTSFYRFLSNKKVTISAIMASKDKHIKKVVTGKHVLCVGDTCEDSLKAQIKHIKDADRVGKLSDNTTPGFLSHLNILLDAQTGHGLGIGSMLMWNRLSDPTEKPVRYEDKESSKWELGIKDTMDITSGACEVTYVFDQEADLFDLIHFVENLDDKHHFLIRSHYNRNVEYKGEKIPIQSALETQEFADSYRFKVSELPRRKVTRGYKPARKAREAVMNVRYCQVTLPSTPTASRKGKVAVYVVEAVESEQTVPQGEPPIRWQILTSHEVSSFEKACQIIEWYKSRWMIEQLFRISKKKGFNIEGCELEYLDSIMKMAAVVYSSSFDVLRLMLSRDKSDAQPIEEVFDEQEQTCLHILNKKYEGNTLLQKNPYPPTQLSYAAWIIGRMGGWKGLKSQGLPGPITMKEGLDKFYVFVEAWMLIKESNA